MRLEETKAACKRLLLFLTILPLTACASAPQPVNLPPPSAPPEITTAGVQTSFAKVIERVMPAVVTIRVKVPARGPNQFPFRNDPSLRRLFGDRLPSPDQKPRERGPASGVLVTADGYILTNHHVLDGAEEIQVELNGRRTVNARLVGSDPPSDLGVLKIDETGLPALALADSDKVRVGDVVIAVSNPWGIDQTITMEIVSATGGRTGLSDGTFADFLQTDAPGNRINSGGALVDSNGDLIGINSQVLSAAGGSTGIGFVIPSNMARSVLDQLVKNGRVQRGHLGIVSQPVTEDMAASLGLSSSRGVIVSQVNPDSPAERAGLQRGDIILALNGNVVSDANSFRNEIAATPPGRAVTLRITRGGNEQELRALLSQFEMEEPAPAAKTEKTPPKETGGLGMSVEPLTPALAEELELNEGAGVVVNKIDPFGPAAEVGIRQGDIIEQVNQQPVSSAAELRQLVERAGNRPVLLLVNHRGKTTFVTVRPR